MWVGERNPLVCDIGSDHSSLMESEEKYPPGHLQSSGHLISTGIYIDHFVYGLRWASGEICTVWDEFIRILYPARIAICKK